MPDINLISADQKRLSRTKKTVWVATVFGLLFLIISSISAVAMYSFHLVQSRQIRAKESSIFGLQRQLTDLAKVEQRQVLIHNRLEESQKILAARVALDERLNRLVFVFPDNVLLEGIKTSAAAKTAEINLRSDSFAGFFDTVKILRAAGFAAVNFEGIDRDKQGVYRLKIMITI